MNFLYLLERIRNPILDALFSVLTYLGDEVCFILIVLLMFWCVDKRMGYYLIAVGFAGTILNQTLKIMFRVPRPWILDPDFSIVESARAGATGYSFPSGHTQNAVGIYGSIIAWDRRRWVKCLALVPVVLVPLSRMYLGVHTPMDVGVSALLAIILVVLFYPIMRRSEDKPVCMTAALGVVALLGVFSILYVMLASFPADVDPANLTHAVENAWKLTGAAIGIVLVWFVDARHLHFETKAKWYAQILKIVLGAAVVLGIKSVLKAPLHAILPDHLGDLIRYFAVAVTAGILWPMTFPFFAKLGAKKHG